MNYKINKKYLGIIFIILSALCFSLMNVFIKLAGDIPTIQKSFFSNLISVLFSFIILKKNHIKPGWKKGNLKFHIIRSASGTLGILFNFYAVDHMMISDASMLNKISPFFAVIFSFIFLKEKVSPIQILLVITAFTGALFIIKPSFTGMDFFPALIGFLGGMGAGAAYTATRHLGQKGEKEPFIVFFFSAFSCVATLPYVIINFHQMRVIQVIFLLLAGLSTSGLLLFITIAYKYSPAKEISIYDYSQIIFSALLGLIIFGQLPDILSFIGYAVILTAAIIMFIYNNKKSKEFS